MQLFRKSFVVATLFLFALTSVFAAGGQESTGAATESSAMQGPREVGYTLPLSTEGETLRIATVAQVSRDAMESMPVLLAMQEATGVKVEWETALGQDYATMIQTRLAASSDLPDIVQLPGTPLKYALEGVIADLTEMIPWYAPNYQKWLETVPGARKFVTTPDGKIYTFPGTIKEDISKMASNPYLIEVRADWLEKLGLNFPETLDDLHDVLVAFKDGDPNGNGTDDEIPFSPQISQADVGFALAWAFDLHLSPQANDGFYPDANGKIVYEWIEPRAKEWLTLMNEWYEDGLIDPGFANLEWAKWNSQILNSITGVTVARGKAAANNWNKKIRNNSGIPEAGFSPIPPVRGPYARMFENDMQAAVNPHYGISATSDKQELSVKFLDYISYSDQGIIWGEYGIENVSYVIENGELQYSDEIKNHEEGFVRGMTALGALHHLCLPLVHTVEGIQKRSDVTGSAIIKTIADITAGYAEPIGITRVMETAEQSEILADRMADIDTYREEMIINFIIGSRSLDEFDKYVSNIKKMGIDEVLQVKQEQYER
jgi:putative aldouronate transport system substrate-binding protein